MKITKRLGQPMNLLSLPEIKIIKISAHQNDWGMERRYAVLGGVLYVDEQPV